MKWQALFDLESLEIWRESKGTGMQGESEQDTCQKGVTLIHTDCNLFPLFKKHSWSG